MPIDLLEFIGLVVTGFTSCAEFGSYAFVHPVIRGLPREHHLSVEKGLLKTFGRVMPVLMTLCVVFSFAYAMQLRAAQGLANTAIASRLGVTRQAARQHYQRRHRDSGRPQNQVA